MIHLLTFLLIALFAIQYFSQSTKTLRRVNTASRIRTGRLSYRDIVSISQQMYTERHYGLIWWRPGNVVATCRYYLSTNGRLYKRIVNPTGHTTVEFISFWDALNELRPYFTRQLTDEIEYLTNPQSARPLFISQFIRPAAAII